SMCLRPIGCVFGSAPVTPTRRAKSVLLGLWHTTQYSTRLRRFPWMLNPCEKTPWHEAQFDWSTTARRGTTGVPSTLKSSTTFCMTSFTFTVTTGGPGSVTIGTERRASMPTRQVPVPPAGTPLATVVVKVKTPLPLGPVSVPSLVGGRMDGVFTGGAGGVRPPKSLDGPLIASARLLKAGAVRVVSGVPSPFFSRNGTVTAPPGLPLADKSSPTRPLSCVDRSGTVCAPGTEISNSRWSVATWQSVLQKASGCAPGTWFVPGGPAPVGISLGFASSSPPLQPALSPLLTHFP